MPLTDEAARRLYGQYLSENFYVDRWGEAYWPRCAYCTPTFREWLARLS